MRHLLILFLISCTTSTDVERLMGDGSRCQRADEAFVCVSATGKHYVCYADNNGGDLVLCFEAVHARNVE